MAKRKGGRKGSKSKSKSKKGGKKSNQIPLKILEKRLGKLNNVVKSRGGDAY